MAFCKNCGSPVEGQFCAKCGAPVAAPGGYNPPPPDQPYQAAPTAPAAAGLTDNVAGALAYLLGFITGILFLVLAPYNQNRFVRFHAFQSIFFNVAWIALWIVQIIVATILPFGLGLLLSLLGLVIWLGGLIIWIVLMVKAYQGEEFMLPVIGQIAKQQA